MSPDEPKKYDIPEMLLRNPKVHLGVISITRGGKSYAVQKWLKVPFRAGIHFDYLGKPEDSQFQYYSETSEETIYYLQHLSKFSMTTDNLEEIEKSIEILWPMLRQNPHPPLYLAFDEIQFYSDNPIIEQIFHTGGKHNVFGIAIARNLQDIQSRSTSVISQCDDLLLAGGINDVARKKLRTNYEINVPDVVYDHVNQIQEIKDKFGGIQRISSHNYAWYDKRVWDLYDSNFNKIKTVGEKNDETE